MSLASLQDAGSFGIRFPVVSLRSTTGEWLETLRVKSQKSATSKLTLRVTSSDASLFGKTREEKQCLRP